MQRKIKLCISKVVQTVIRTNQWAADYLLQYSLGLNSSASVLNHIISNLNFVRPIPQLSLLCNVVHVLVTHTW